MIEIPLSPSMDERLQRLIAFANQVLDVCDELGIDPILDGSLAVRPHLQDSSISVRDIDLNSSEIKFPVLLQALRARNIACETQPWRVLQARHDDLKVEFSAIEFWMQGISGPHETVFLENHTLRMVNRDDLRELY